MRILNSQRAGVGFGQSGQEDIGKVDEQSSNSLLRGVIEPGQGNMEQNVGNGVGSKNFLPVRFCNHI